MLKDKPAENRQIFFPKHDVTSVTMLDDGYILTTAMKASLDSQNSEPEPV